MCYLQEADQLAQELMKKMDGGMKLTLTEQVTAPPPAGLPNGLPSCQGNLRLLNDNRHCDRVMTFIKSR